MGDKLTHLALVTLLLVLGSLLPGCVVVPRTMWRHAEQNRLHMNEVRAGQTMREVRSIMASPPEKREVRARFDGKTVEFWSYVTDYGRRLDTTITFVDGTVDEIRATPWGEKD